MRQVHDRPSVSFHVGVVAQSCPGRRAPRRLLLVLSLLFAAAASPASVRAQAIKISPNSDTTVVLANSSGLTTSFKVLNDSTASVTVLLTCTPGGNVTSCTNVPRQLRLQRAIQLR
jgi:membrane-bound ClpP family serine protease